MSVASTSLSTNPLQYLQSLLGGSTTGAASSSASAGSLASLIGPFSSLGTGSQAPASASGTSTGAPVTGSAPAPLSSGMLSALLALQSQDGSAAAGAPTDGSDLATDAGLSAPTSQKYAHHHHHKQIMDAQAQLTSVAPPTTNATA